MGRWCESKLLGEHVGGSAVRSIYFVSKIHTISASQTCSSNHAFADRKDEQLLLISVGAKQVLTSWLLQYRSTDNDKLHYDGLNTDSQFVSSSTSGFSSISFQWLSTHMPPKFASTHQKVKKLETSENGNSSTMKSSLSGLDEALSKKQKPKPDVLDQHENDWRYMAVTAFLVKHADSR